MADPDELRAWAGVDAYFSVLSPDDEHLRATTEAARNAGLPDIAVAPNQGKLLKLLAETAGARRILEIGTLGGYSTLWLARALPPGGTLVTLEIDPAHAEVARASLASAGVGDRVDVVLAPASQTLDRLLREGVEPFDLVFVDADKQSLARYVEQTLALSHPGTLVVVDNVVRGGRVVDADSADPSVQGVRRLVELLTDHPRLDATVVQTVGVKGHDGFALLRVLP